MSSQWQVDLSRDAKKFYKKLGRSGKKPSILDVIDALVLDLKKNGPVRKNWPNYSIIDKGKWFYYHCHIKDGCPTYVACWEADEKTKKIEVSYVGTREGAPYS